MILRFPLRLVLEQIASLYNFTPSFCRIRKLQQEFHRLKNGRLPPCSKSSRSTLAQFILVLFHIFNFQTATYAQSSTWINPHQGQWNNGSNWNNGVPVRQAFLASGGTTIISTPTKIHTLFIGDTDNKGANLQISRGSLSTFRTHIGVQAPSTVTVDSGTWDNRSTIFLGYTSSGTLNVSGGVVTTQNLTIGGAPDKVGAGAMSVTSGTINVANALVIGSNGQASLMIKNGGSVSAPFVKVASHRGQTEASLSITGGVLTTSHLYTDGGTANILINGGTIRSLQQNSNLLTGFRNGAVTVGANNGVIDTNGFTTTIKSSISGNGGLEIKGSGTLISTSNHTYTGLTTIAENTSLQIGTRQRAGHVASNIVNNGELILEAAQSVPGIISGAGSLKKSGPGTSVLFGPNSYTGDTLVDDGTLAAGAHDAFSSKSNVILAATSTLDMQGFNQTIGGLSGEAGSTVINNGATDSVLTTGANNSNDVFKGIISESSSQIVLQKIGTGTLVLTGDNTYTGDTIISSGAVQLGQGGTNGSIVGDVINNSHLIIDRSDTVQFSGSVSGIGAVTKNGDGTVIMTVDNTYTGGTVVNSGTVQLGDGGSTGSIVGNIKNDGALVLNRSGTLTIPGIISGTGAVTQAGPGRSILTAPNTYTGPTYVKVGTLAQATVRAFSPNSHVIISSDGTVDVAGFHAAISTLSGEKGSSLTNTGHATAIVTVGTSNIDQIFEGNISGTSLAIHKVGTGKMTLTGRNTHQEGTVIKEGTLELGDGKVSGSHEGKIINNAALVFNNPDQVTFSGVISGIGTVSQIGKGTTVLTANNNYTGGTTIHSGTLQLGNGGNRGSIVGNIANNGALVAKRSDELILEGTIFGTGSFLQVGTGNTILTGNNSYIGETTIHSGTLQLGNGGTNGSMKGNIKNNSVLVLNRSDTLTLTSVVFGSGELVQKGTGRSILSAHNTYSGATLIQFGTLSQGKANALSRDSSVFIETGGTLDIGGLDGTIAGLSGKTGAKVINSGKTEATLSTGGNNANDVFAGTIEGNLALNKTGSGKFTLTGNNTYTKGTTIKQGTLQLGNGGTSGSVIGDIANNGSLVFNRSDDVVFADIISGTGSLTQAGKGTLRLAGNNTYSGGTQIESGTLIGTTSSLQGKIKNGSSLVFTQSSTGNYRGIISGPGNVIIDSPLGKINFDSDQIFTGATAVRAGELSVNAQLNSSQILIDPNGIMSGTGRLSGNLVNSGMLNPGNNGVGTFTIGGNYIQRADGSLAIQLQNYENFDRVAVSGNAQLDGTIRVDLLDGFIPLTNSKFTVLTAKSVTGTFSKAVYDPTIMLEVLYDRHPGAVHLLIGRKELVGFTPVQQSVADALNTMTAYQKALRISAGNRLFQIASTTANVPTGKKNPTSATDIDTKTILGRILTPAAISGIPATTRVPGTPGMIVDSVRQTGAADIDGVAGGTAEGATTSTDTASDPTSGKSGPPPKAAAAPTIMGAGAAAAAGIAASTESAGAVTGDPAAGTSSDPNNGDPNGEVANGSKDGVTDSSLDKAVWMMRFLSDAELADILEQLIPRMLANFKDILFNATNTQYGQITNRMAAIRAGVDDISIQGLRPEPMVEQVNKHETKNIYTPKFTCEPSPWSIFASASGVFSNITSPGNFPGIRSATGYFSAGADYRVTSFASTGIYAGYQGIRSKYTDGSWFRSNGVKFGLYGTAEWNGLYINAIVGGGTNFLNLNRSIRIKNQQWVARSYPFNGELDSLLGGGYEFQLGPWRFGANTSIQYTYLGISALNESGAGTLNVRTSTHNPSSLVYSLGGSISYLWEISPSYRILPTIGLSWQHEFLNYGERIEARFANGAGAPFFFFTPTGARNNAFGVAGITAQLGRYFGVYTYYNPQFGGGQVVSHGIQVGLNYNF